MYDTDGDCSPTIDISHAKIHRGNSFVYAREFTIASSGSSAILIVPAVGEELHFTADISTKGASISRLYRNPVIASNGSEVDWLNRNDKYQGTKVLTSKVYLNPSYSLAALPNKGLLDTGYIGAGVRGGIGLSVSKDEFVMTNDNKYVLETVDTAAASNPSAVVLQVYRAGQPY